MLVNASVRSIVKDATCNKMFSFSVSNIPPEVVQCISFITICLGSIGMNGVISRSCYKGTILHRNDRKMTILWSFSYNSFVKFHRMVFHVHFL